MNKRVYISLPITGFQLEEIFGKKALTRRKSRPLLRLTSMKTFRYLIVS